MLIVYLRILAGQLVLQSLGFALERMRVFDKLLFGAYQLSLEVGLLFCQLGVLEFEFLHLVVVDVPFLVVAHLCLNY